MSIITEYLDNGLNKPATRMVAKILRERGCKHRISRDLRVFELLGYATTQTVNQRQGDVLLMLKYECNRCKELCSLHQSKSIQIDRLNTATKSCRETIFQLILLSGRIV